MRFDELDRMDATAPPIVASVFVEVTKVLAVTTILAVVVVMAVETEF